MSETPKIRIAGLRKAFGPKTVLDGVDLSVAAGASLVVIGGSGTGKSVLLKTILGLIAPDAGSIRIDGEETVGVDARSRERVNSRIGMLFQGAALFDSLSVWENVAFGLIQGQGMGRVEARKRALDNLAAVGLPSAVGDLSPAELSGGMKKRVGLARAIATRPEIIFFDEPTTGLDPITADAINDLIVEMVKELNCAAISITHDMPSARKISDEIAMLHNGKIVWRGPTSTLDASGNAMVDQFVAGRADGPIQAVV
jgi:phospholipid/cholesterol/gamma-HCH transport system ATP-binding protein